MTVFDMETIELLHKLYPCDIAIWGFKNAQSGTWGVQKKCIYFSRQEDIDKFIAFVKAYKPDLD